MTLFLAVTLVIAAMIAIGQSARLYLCESERDDFQLKWEQSINSRNSSDHMIYEWTNRDLVRKWEMRYPHVRKMSDSRKYSEWLTFCANYPTRASMERQLGEYHNPTEGVKL